MSSDPVLPAAGERALRQALIEAMAQSCMERGYLDTTIEDLLAATGIARGDFDRHFADKEACGVAAVDDALAAGIGAVSEAFTGDVSEAEIAMQALVGLLGLFARRPGLGNLAMVGSRQMMPDAAHQRYVNGFVILRAMLDRLRSDSALAGNAPPCAARGALGGGEAAVRRAIVGRRASELPKLLPSLIYSAIVPFLGQREGLRLSRQARRLVVAPER